MNNNSQVPALTRAIMIMEFIAQHGPSSGIEIIGGLQLPKSSVYLILAELKKQGFLSQDIHDNYCLWVKLVELSSYALEKIDLRELSRSRLTTLMQETNLLCHLGVIDQGKAFYILKVESDSTISVKSHEGKALSLYRSGIGKCLLAWQDESLQEKIISEIDFIPTTVNTIATPGALRNELSKIRYQGWSFDNGEDYIDVRCVAAPVFNHHNEPIAAISIVGTRLQINDDNRDYLAGLTIRCAKDISSLMGWKKTEQNKSTARSINNEIAKN